MMHAGKSSKTDIVLCYMDNRVDHAFLEKIRDRIKHIQVDALTMNQESLAECLYDRNGTILFRNSNSPSAPTPHRPRCWREILSSWWTIPPPY